jgi:hypothetical protein
VAHASALDIAKIIFDKGILWIVTKIKTRDNQVLLCRRRIIALSTSPG